jgi:hypothetical protein
MHHYNPGAKKRGKNILIEWFSRVNKCSFRDLTADNQNLAVACGFVSFGVDELLVVSLKSQQPDHQSAIS